MIKELLRMCNNQPEAQHSYNEAETTKRTYAHLAYDIVQNYRQERHT